MNIPFRPARPEDADAMAPLVYSSGPPSFDYVFAHKTRLGTLDFLTRNLRQPHGEFGHAIHTVGEAEGRVVAAAATFMGAQTLPFTLSAFRAIFGAYGPIQGAGVCVRGLRVEHTIVPPPKGGAVMIVHVGVAPEFRGRGFGRQLMQKMIEQAREKGGTTAVLDVSVENPRARKLYESLGFRVTAENPSTLANSTARVPSHRRMELELS